MRKAGLVSIDQDMKWAGGRYYLQHLVRCVASLPEAERISLCSVSWAAPVGNDPFDEVRTLLGEHIVAAPLAGLIPRLIRKLKRLFLRTSGARDLFDDTRIDVFFPIPPCDHSGTPYVFWLPDFQYLRRPDLMSGALCKALERYYLDHVYKASRIVLSSVDAQNDFAKVYPDLMHLTHVVRFCSVPDDSWWTLKPADVAERYGLPEKFLIVCNQFTRHKNHLSLMRAIDVAVTAREVDVHLVCTGSTFDHRGEDYVGQVRSYLDARDLSNRVHILGLIPRADQIALLRCSVAVVQPSCFEGWSTIIEDGKTLGKVILASDLPVHREQLGQDYPHYLPLDDEDAWPDAIAGVWANLHAGPKLCDEQEALARLESAKADCGMAFVMALRAAGAEVT